MLVHVKQHVSIGLFGAVSGCEAERSMVVKLKKDACM